MRFEQYATKKRVNLRAVELDVLSEDLIQAAITSIVKTAVRLNTIVHKPGLMCLRPAEAFTPEQYAFHLDINVLGTQQVEHAVLPHMRTASKGLIV